MTELTLGIVGQGKTSPENATALLEDFVDSREVGDDDVRLIFVLDENWDEVKEELWNYFEDFDYEVVYNDDGADLKGAKEVLDNAASKHKVQRVDKKLASLLEQAEGETALIVLWDHEAEEDDEDVGFDAAEAADDAGIAIYDLTDALDTVRFTEDDDDESKDEAAEKKSEGRRKKEPKQDDDSDEGGPELADGPYSREELENMNRKEVKDLAVRAGLVSEQARTHTKTLITQLLEHYDQAEDAYAEETEKTEEKAEKPTKKPTRKSTAKKSAGRSSRSAKKEKETEKSSGDGKKDGAAQEVDLDEVLTEIQRVVTESMQAELANWEEKIAETVVERVHPSEREEEPDKEESSGSTKTQTRRRRRRQ